MADNIDLVWILKEFEQYYIFKFGKAPKFTRKCDSTDSRRSRRTVVGKPPKGVGISVAQSLVLEKHIHLDKFSALDPLPIMDRNLEKPNPGLRLPKLNDSSNESSHSTITSVNSVIPFRTSKSSPKSKALINTSTASSSMTTLCNDEHPQAPPPDLNGLISVKTIDSGSKPSSYQSQTNTQHRVQSPSSIPVPPPAKPHDRIGVEEDKWTEKMLKPLPHFDNSEWRELASIIQRLVFSFPLPVSRCFIYLRF